MGLLMRLTWWTLIGVDKLVKVWCGGCGFGKFYIGHDRLTTTEIYLRSFREDGTKEFLGKWEVRI